MIDHIFGIAIACALIHTFGGSLVTDWIYERYERLRTRVKR